MNNLTPALIDGKPVTTLATTEVRSPYDGSLIATVPACGTAEIDSAVAVAKSRLDVGDLPAHERAAILDRVAAALLERLDEFTQSISTEAAKPLAAARVEAERAVDTVRFSAAAARTLSGEMIAMDASVAGEGMLGFVTRVPIGVVAGITPFNFPLNLVCHKIAPAVAAGAPMVLKPASATPLTALRIVSLFEECGLPPGWLNVVTCDGATATHLVKHPDVSMVTFTGSGPVGWGIRADAPKKRVGLELGNSAPLIIESDADISRAADRIVAGGFNFSGQSCISVQRVYVQRDIYAQLAEAVVSLVEKLGVGDPADPENRVSSLINDSAGQRVAAWIDEATNTGAKLLGSAPLPSPSGSTGRNLIAPTVLGDISSQMKVWSEEVFGPVIGMAEYGTLDEAIAMANDTRYGLQAGIFTSDLTKAIRASRELRFGGVIVNDVPAFRTDQQPYGGVGDSGNTREGPAYAVQEMTERRTVMIRP
ncbi:MAG TPA: aldehyde dehydrogenase family protein [Microthrixaceae bacterium]|nr:aldehyde dehydrogenase family protein [Microthrixaceae bacterium]